MLSLDLVLEDAQRREVWRGPLPAHTLERLIADAHLHGILCAALPNDGRPTRLDACALEPHAERPRLRVEVGAGTASFGKWYVPEQALRDDAEVVVTQLLATKVIDAGTYRFRCVPSAGDQAAVPLPRSLPALTRRSLWDLGVPTPPACRHPALLLPRHHAERLVAQARAAADVEVGALLVVEPCLVTETVPCRFAVRVLDAVPLAHGTTGTATRLRITPAALAAVAVDEARGRCRGGVAHSHVFGSVAEAHVLSSDDKSFATAFFWRPFGLQLVIDPRFVAPEDAIAAFCWIDGALARVCCTLTHEEVACQPSALPN